jgi:hypothetical protein
MNKPIKQYIQDLNTETVNTVRHLDTKIFIALAHKEYHKQKLKHNNHFTQMTITYNFTNSRKANKM